MIIESEEVKRKKAKDKFDASIANNVLKYITPPTKATAAASVTEGIKTTTAKATTPKKALTPFEQAFANARAKGLKTFPWNGKTIAVKMKGEKPKDVSLAYSESTDPRSTVRLKPSDESLAYMNKKADFVRNFPEKVGKVKMQSDRVIRIKNKMMDRSPEKVERNTRMAKRMYRIKYKKDEQNDAVTSYAEKRSKEPVGEPTPKAKKPIDVDRLYGKYVGLLNEDKGMAQDVLNLWAKKREENGYSEKDWNTLMDKIRGRK